MRAEFTFIFPLHSGLHARPASQWVKALQPFQIGCKLTNRRTGEEINGQSVLALVSGDVRRGDECDVELQGPDATSALDAMREFVQHVLPQEEEEESPIDHDAPPSQLPRLLRGCDADAYAGRGVAGGLAQGRVITIGSLALPPELAAESPGSADDELARIQLALQAVASDLQHEQDAASGIATDILTAHRAILDDVELRSKLTALTDTGLSAGHAIVETGQAFITQLSQSETAYIRDRAADVKDICLRLLEKLYGNTCLSLPTLDPDRPSIVVSDDLSPRQLLSMDRAGIAALVLGCVGVTSHVVILARSFDIPTITHVANPTHQLADGLFAIVDADRGWAFCPVEPMVKSFYDREHRVKQRRRSHLNRYVVATGRTADDRALKVLANVSSADAVDHAISSGAEGVGLFRSEMMFLGRDAPPSEQEQYEAYRQAVVAADGRPMTIRLLDIGGDKPCPYIHLTAEDNPFLGCRGVRAYPTNLPVIDTQLRAILRASTTGPIRLMIPMVSTVDEVRWVRQRIEKLSEILQREHKGFTPQLSVGIMLEVPAAVMAMDQLCNDADFFSLGTNDLLQYFIAVDRGNEAVAQLYDTLHPGFLAFLKIAADGAHRGGRPIGLCGEMASTRANLPLLVGLGLDSISVSLSVLTDLKEGIADLDSGKCKALLTDLVAGRDSQHVGELLRGTVSTDRPMTDPACVILNSTAQSRAEAIKELADMMYVVGRTGSSQQLEDALWAREEAFSTGLGHGFAIPHCKSNAVAVNTIGVLRLNQPVPWGDSDEEPVRVVILLAMREADAHGGHMRVFSKLARQVMHESFRQQLIDADDPEKMVGFLTETLFEQHKPHEALDRIDLSRSN